MAYIGVCLRCNYHSFGVERSLLIDEMDLHGIEVHDRAEYTVGYIPDRLYQSYLIAKDNPEFWEAIRNYKKLAKSFCKS
jgi:hypothetical protein